VTHRWGFHTGGGGNHPNGSRSCPSHGYVLPLRTASTPSAESKPVPVLTAGYVIPARRCDALRNKRLAAVLRGSRAGERLPAADLPHRGGVVPHLGLDFHAESRLLGNLDESIPRCEGILQHGRPVALVKALAARPQPATPGSPTSWRVPSWDRSGIERGPRLKLDRDD